MNRIAETWYFRGKAARGANASRDLRDGRISLQNRQAWLQGWDDEDELQCPRDSKAVEEFNEFLADLLVELKGS